MPYEILLQHVSIVPCLCVFGISHFGLYYLYSSTNDELTAPAINVPKLGHTKRHPERGIVSRSTKGITNARQLLARDLFELKRVYPDIPNSALKELIDMNKKMYPEMRK